MFTDRERISEFDLKLMELNVETLGIPEAEYDATVTMPANDFQRICKDLTSFGETVAVSITKDAIKFHVSGDVGDASVTVRQFVDGPKVPADANAGKTRVHNKCAHRESR